MVIKRKLVAWLLVFAMTCGMFSGVKVSTASENEAETGFKMSTDLQWNDEGCIDSVNNLDKTEKWAENSDKTLLAFSYTSAEGEEICPEWEELKVEINTGTSEEPVYEEVDDITATLSGDLSEEMWETDISIYEVCFPEVEFGEIAEYRFSYADAENEDYVTLYYCAKTFGFYQYKETQDNSGNNKDNGNGTKYLKNMYYDDSDVTFYMLPYTDDPSCVLSAQDTAFTGTMWDEYGEASEVDMQTLFTVNEVDTDDDENTFEGYELTLKAKECNGTSLELVFHGEQTWYDENQEMTASSIREEYLSIQPTGDGTFLLVHDNDFNPGIDLCTIRYDEKGNEVGEERYLADRGIDDHGNFYVEKYYKAADITIYKLESEWNEELGKDVEKRVEVSGVVQDTEDEEGNPYLSFIFKEAGDYVITGAQDEEVRIDVHSGVWTGFYTSEDSECIYEYSTTGKENDSTIYFIVKDLGDIRVESIELDAVDGKKVEEANEKDYFTYEDVTDEADTTKKVYKIQLTMDKSFEIAVNTWVTDDCYRWEDNISMWIDYKQTGLVAADPEWGDDGLTGNIYEDSYAKQMQGEVDLVRWVYLGTTEDAETYTPVPATAFTESGENKIQINGSTEYIVKEKEEYPFQRDTDTVIVDESLSEAGIYGFYMKDDMEITYGEDTIRLEKVLPSIGIYTSNEANFDTYVSEQYLLNVKEMYNGKDFYILPREGVSDYTYKLETIDKTTLVDGETYPFEHVSDEHPAGYYSAEFNKPVKVTVSECSGSFLRIKGEITWGENDVETMEKYVELKYDKKTQGVILEDDSPHEGFGGCLIAKSDYKVSQWWQMAGNVYYWVHGSTIQEVVDELSAIAAKGEVTVDGKTYPISMTDYIWINTSYFKYSKDFANTSQHVVTPSNIKGIIMQAEAEAPYSLFDDGKTKGYYQVAEWKKDSEVILLTQPGEGAKYYKVKELSEEEALKQRADYVVENYEEAFTEEELKEAGYEPIVDEWGNPQNAYPVYHPNLFVDATIEVKIIGRFGESKDNKQVQLGFYEGSENKSIINGKEFSAKDIGTETVVGDEGNQVTVKVKEFKASTECGKATIDGTSCNVTMDGKNEELRKKVDIYQKGNDDYADAKAVAEGQELKVKLEANAAKDSHADAKKVGEQIKKDCASNKKKASKIQYLDINMKYQVGSRDSKAVTETKEDMDITIDIPESFHKTDANHKNRCYKVYRYHDGKVDVLDAEYDKETKKLHFKTNKFSMYALVAEDDADDTAEPTAKPTTKPTAVPAVKVSDKVKTKNGTCKVTAVRANGTVEIAFTPNKTNKKAKKPKIDKKVTINGKEYVVTAIANNAFAGNKKMTSITIPSTVTKIGKNAFKGCTKLKKITISKKVTSIGSNAFRGCKKLKTVTFAGSAIKTIGKNAFKGIEKKATIKVPKKKKTAYKRILKKSGYKGKVK